MGAQQSQGFTEKAGMAGQLVLAMVARGANEVTQFENLVKLKWLVASSATEAMNLRRLVYHAPNATNEQGVNLFFLCIYKLSKSLHIVTPAERGEFLAFLVTRFSESDFENEVQISSGLPACVLTMLAFVVQHRGGQQESVPFPVGLVLQLIHMYGRYQTFSTKFIEGQGQKYLTHILSMDVEQHVKASAASGLVLLSKWARFPLVVEKYYRHTLQAMLSSTIDMKMAAATLVANCIEHAASQSSALRNAETLIEGGLLESLTDTFKEQAPYVATITHPEVLLQVYTALAAISHALAALTISETAVALVTQDVRALLQCLMTVNHAEAMRAQGDETERSVAASGVSSAAGFSNEVQLLRFYVTLVTYRISHVTKNQEVLVNNGAFRALLLTLYTADTPTQLARETNLNLLKTMQRLTHSNVVWRRVLMMEDSFPNILLCLRQSSKQQVLHGLYIVDNLIPRDSGLDHPLVELFSQVVGLAITAALCNVINQVAGLAEAEVEDKVTLRLALDVLLRLSTFSERIVEDIWEEIEIREFKVFLEYCEDRELRRLAAGIVKLFLHKPEYLLHLKQVGLFGVVEDELRTNYEQPLAQQPHFEEPAYPYPPQYHEAPYPQQAHPQPHFQHSLPPQPQQYQQYQSDHPQQHLKLSPQSYGGKEYTRHEYWDQSGARPAPPMKPPSPREEAAEKIQKYYRRHYNAVPENRSRSRLVMYSDAVFEKLQMHEQVVKELTALYDSHRHFVSSLAPFIVEGVKIMPTEPNITTAEQAEAVALWRKFDRTSPGDELRVIAEFKDSGKAINAHSQAMWDNMMHMDDDEDEGQDQDDDLFFHGMATKIQRVWRGYRCRKQLVENLSQYRHLKRLNNRSYQVSREIMAIRQAAAVMIQRVWRGVVARDQVWCIIVAAMTIQTAWRRYVTVKHTGKYFKEETEPTAYKDILEMDDVILQEETGPEEFAFEPEHEAGAEAERESETYSLSGSSQPSSRASSAKGAARPPTRASSSHSRPQSRISQTRPRSRAGKQGSPALESRVATPPASADVLDIPPSAAAMDAESGPPAPEIPFDVVEDTFPEAEPTPTPDQAMEALRREEKERRRREYVDAVGAAKLKQEMLAVRVGACLTIQRFQRGKWGRDEARRARAQKKVFARIKARWSDAGNQNAVHIQRVVRGYFARKVVQHLMWVREQRAVKGLSLRHTAASQQQTWQRSILGQRLIHIRKGAARELRRQEEEEKRRQDRYVRAAAEKKRKALESAEQQVRVFEATQRRQKLEAAVKIQSAWRSKAMRSEVFAWAAAAMKIQALWRGFLARKNFQAMVGGLVDDSEEIESKFTSLSFMASAVPMDMDVLASSMRNPKPADTAPAPLKTQAPQADAPVSAPKDSGFGHHHHSPEESENCPFCSAWNKRTVGGAQKRKKERKQKKMVHGEVAAAKAALAAPPDTFFGADSILLKSFTADQITEPRHPAADLPTPSGKNSPLIPLNHEPAPLQSASSGMGFQPQMVRNTSVAPLSQRPDFASTGGNVLGASWSALGASYTGSVGGSPDYGGSIHKMHEELQTTQKLLDERLLETQRRQEELLRQQQALMDEESEPSSIASTPRPISASSRSSGRMVTGPRAIKASSAPVAVRSPLAKADPHTENWMADLTVMSYTSEAEDPNHLTLAQEEQILQAAKPVIERLAIEEEVRRQQMEWQCWDQMSRLPLHPNLQIQDQLKATAPPRSIGAARGPPLRHVYLEQLLANDAKLNALDLTNQRLTDVTVYPIAVALANNTHVKRLVLDSNQVGDATASALAKALKTNTALQRLSLQHNDLSPAGVAMLVYAMVASQSIRQLCVQENDAEASTIKDIVKEHKGLVIAKDGSVWRT